MWSLHLVVMIIIITGDWCFSSIVYPLPVIWSVLSWMEALGYQYDIHTSCRWFTQPFMRIITPPAKAFRQHYLPRSSSYNFALSQLNDIFRVATCQRFVQEKLIFFKVRAFEKIIMEILKRDECQANVRRFLAGRFWKVCYNSHSCNRKLNCLSSWLKVAFPVVWISWQHHKNW